MNNEQDKDETDKKDDIDVAAAVAVLTRRCRMEDWFPSFRSVLRKLKAQAKEKSDDANLWGMMATLHLSLGDVEAAVDDLIDAFVRDPKCVGALKEMLQIAVLRGDVDMVRVYADKLRVAEASNPWAAFYDWFATVGADYGCRDASDVEGVFREMAREDRGNPHLYRIATRVFTIRQDYVTAYAWASCGCRFMRDEPPEKGFLPLKSIVIQDNNELVNEVELSGNNAEACRASDRLKHEILSA